jgi:hypothetical protein
MLVLRGLKLGPKSGRGPGRGPFRARARSSRSEGADCHRHCQWQSPWQSARWAQELVEEQLRSLRGGDCHTATVFETGRAGASTHQSTKVDEPSRLTSSAATLPVGSGPRRHGQPLHCMERGRRLPFTSGRCRPMPIRRGQAVPRVAGPRRRCRPRRHACVTWPCPAPTRFAGRCRGTWPA